MSGKPSCCGSGAPHGSKPDVHGNGDPQHSQELKHTHDAGCGHDHDHGHDHEHGHDHSHHHDHSHSHDACGCGEHHDHDHSHGHNHSHDHGACGCGSGHEAEDAANAALAAAAAEAAAAGAISSVYRIEGMDCADCARKLEKRVGALATVQIASVNYGAAKMTVIHDGTAGEAVMQTVRQAGYTAIADNGVLSGTHGELPFWKRNKKAVPTAVSGAVFLVAWLLALTEVAPESAVTLLYAAAMVIGGFRIARTGIYGLKSGTIGMDLLMTVAAIGAGCIGQWEEGAAVVVLFSLGETLEAFTMDRTRRSIRGLMDLSPKEALVRRQGSEMKLPTGQIEVGDILLVKPGEKIAMDGMVVQGTSAVNQAPITGESVPVLKETGSEAFAGTINGEGALEIRVTRRVEDNTLSRIIRMVEDAQAQKAPSQRFIDAFAKYYTPAVLLIALGIAVIPALVLGQPFEPWFYRALMMLVVSCPCALVISTPVSIVSAIGNAARHGVLIKGGAYLERLGAVEAVAFDKTGTLTAGVPEVTECIPLGGRTAEEVLTVAGGIEARSGHPVGEAIVRKAKREGVPLADIADFAAVPGRGAKAQVGGSLFFIGSPRWFVQELGISLDSLQGELERLESQGNTVMVLGTVEEPWAVFAASDELRPNSRTALEQLRAAGIRQAVMLTGDNRGTAEATASKLGGIAYRAELLPQDKVTAVRELMNEHGYVAMVGDGVNDAPALATATVGIAMGAAGTDTALETADVALMADDLSKLAYTVQLSRRALRIIKQNIAFSLLVKAVFLALIFFGASTLWLAVLADTGSSLIVIANGMRLLRIKP